MSSHCFNDGYKLTLMPDSLERPCMDHMQFLMVRAHDAEETISGHALMATAPPDAHIANNPEEKYPHQMPDIQTPDLMKLLDLSNRLPLDGEITPSWPGRWFCSIQGSKS